MTYTQVRAKHMGIKKGDYLYRLEYEYNGKTIRNLYLYETARSWDVDFPKNRNIPYLIDRVQWDGIEDFSFSNGD